MSNMKDYAIEIFNMLPKDAQDTIREKIIADEAKKKEDEQKLKDESASIVNNIFESLTK